MSEVPTGIVERVFSYADKPWKVLAIIVLGLAAGGGYAVWEQRATIAQAVLQSYVTPSLRVDRFPVIAQQLLTNTTADLVQLNSVDLPANVVQPVDGLLRGDPSWKPIPRPFPIFSDITPFNYDQIGKIIGGQVMCWDLHAVDHLVQAFDVGMKRSCIVAVPPVSGVLIGALTIAWKQPPSAAAEETYRVEMARQAPKLATW